MQKKIRLLKENLYSGHSDYKKGNEYFWAVFKCFVKKRMRFRNGAEIIPGTLLL